MKIKFVIIDEPINLQSNVACDLWQKAIWAKEQGYRKHYQCKILPLSSDEFVATHLILANELPNGKLEPISMYKSMRYSQAKKYQLPFGATELLKNTSYKNSLVLKKILSEESDISYDSSWTINPKYKSCDKEFSAFARDCLTVFCANYHLDFGFKRWITAGVTKYKMDKYFDWMGCKEITGEFSLPIIDNQTVRMFYNSGDNHSSNVNDVLNKYKEAWSERLIYKPKVVKNKIKIAA